MSRTTKNVIVAIPVILLFLAIFIPNVIEPRKSVSMNACANNLRWLEKGKKQWMLENHKTTNDVPAWEDVQPYINPNSYLPKCPSGGIYKLGRIGEPPTCSLGGVGHTLPSDD